MGRAALGRGAQLILQGTEAKFNMVLSGLENNGSKFTRDECKVLYLGGRFAIHRLDHSSRGCLALRGGRRGLAGA